jgi:hypothetical protein
LPGELSNFVTVETVGFEKFSEFILPKTELKKVQKPVIVVGLQYRQCSEITKNVDRGTSDFVYNYRFENSKYNEFKCTILIFQN